MTKKKINIVSLFSQFDVDVDDVIHCSPYHFRCIFLQAIAFIFDINNPSSNTDNNLHTYI